MNAKTLRNTAVLGLATALASIPLGCGSDNAPPDTGALYAATGKVVTKEGAPVSGGEIYLIPVGAGHESHASIGPDGSFNLSTYGDEGASPGEYVARLEPPAEAMQPASKKKGVMKAPYDRKYLDEGTSDLKVTIKPEPNELDLKLQ